MSDPNTPTPSTTGRGPLVAAIGVVLAAALGITALIVALPKDGTLATTDVVAILGAVLSPIVAIASAYYGIAVSAGVAAKSGEQTTQALKIAEDNQSNLKDAIARLDAR